MQDSRISSAFRPRHLMVSAGLMGLAACGGNGSGGSYGDSTGSAGGGYGGAPGAPASTYAVTALVSNGVVAAKTTDPDLRNPWGLVFAPNDVVWTANNASQTSTLYDGNGQKNALTVALPGGGRGAANPTGVVSNGGSQFVIKANGHTAPALFIYAGEGGTLSGWADSVDPQHAITTFDDAAGGAVYKGLAIATDGSGAAHLYAADFHNGRIDAFDDEFAREALPATAFVDPTLPAGYAPFNVQALTVGGQTSLFVAYAQQQARDNDDNAAGAGLGLLDVFDLDGNLKSHLIAAGGKLNAPWGLAMAPAQFGAFGSDLLVGNFGDGLINAFDPASGAFKGTLADASGQPLAIPGLWGLAFGNDSNNQPATTLFYTAGPDQEVDGIYGRIDAGN
jgi:uncharacterized protein (TIGR03118 family)